MVEADAQAEVLDRGLVAEEWTVDEFPNGGWMDGVGIIGLLLPRPQPAGALAPIQTFAQIYLYDAAE